MRSILPFKAAAWALLIAGALSSPTAAHAEELLLSSDPMTQARAAVARRDPAEALARFLRVLSTRPNDLEALTGAGRAALDIGDPSAAIGFYARAEELAPRNGRVKAGLGSAMLQMEKAKAALRLFDDAVDLGVPPAEVASDRGLAYDLRGDNKRAQQEYLLALKTADDAETRRRLALSLAMTGDRPGALLALDPLLRRQDIPAWRVRAFVLALVGDAQGAEAAALAVMPRPQAVALVPFLGRLRGLKPQQQAAAVHFGHFPSEGRRSGEGELLAGAGSTTPPPAAAVGSPLIPSGAPLGRGGSATAAPSEPISTAPRRRPGSGDRLASVMAGVLPQVELESRQAPVAKTAPGFASISPDTAAEVRQPKAGSAKPGEAETRKPLVLATKAIGPKDPVVKSESGAKKDSIASATSGRDKDGAKTDKAADKAKASKATKEADAKTKDGKVTKEADAKAKGKDAGTKEAKSKGSERYWVQVAGGANKADLPKAYGQLKDKAPKLFAGQKAWTTPLRATNRLLVGPFKTLEEAQGFVNRAGKDKLSAFTYTSPPGQEVEKLPAK